MALWDIITLYSKIDLVHYSLVDFASSVESLFVANLRHYIITDKTNFSAMKAIYAIYGQLSPSVRLKQLWFYAIFG